jgi:hypothetical protein
MNNKKGVSEMVSYVLLVIIAIGLGALVFTYLQVYVPKDKTICPEDTAISIESYSCNYTSSANPKSNLSLTLSNKGLFTINAAYIRIGAEGRTVRELINDPRVTGNPSSGFYLSRGLQAPSTPGTVTSAFTGLLPGESTTRIYHPIQINRAGNYEIEIQPAVGTYNKLTICEKSTIVQKITCV